MILRRLHLNFLTKYINKRDVDGKSKLLCVFIHYIYIHNKSNKYVTCNHTVRGIYFIFISFLHAHLSLVFVLLSVKCRRYSTGGLTFAKNKDLISSNQLIESLSLSSYIRYVMCMLVA